MPGQGFGRADRDFFIPDGGGGVGADVAEADVRICPVLEEPVEEDLWRAFVRFGWWRFVCDCEAERVTILLFRHRGLPWRAWERRNRKQAYPQVRCPSLSL